MNKFLFINEFQRKTHKNFFQYFLNNSNASHIYYHAPGRIPTERQQQLRQSEFLKNNIPWSDYPGWIFFVFTFRMLCVMQLVWSNALQNIAKNIINKQNYLTKESWIEQNTHTNKTKKKKFRLLESEAHEMGILSRSRFLSFFLLF